MTITFFCKIDDKKALRVVEFYNQDIIILEKLGHQVKIATNYKEIDWRSDVLFIWWWTYAFIPVFISKFLRIRTVITGTFNYKTNNTSVGFYKRPVWQQILIKYSISNADVNVMVSKNEYDDIKKDWKLSNLVYSPHIIDTEKYTPTLTESKSEPFLFSMIWTGKENLKRKCLPEIIEASRIVLKKHKTLKFYIGGRKGDGFDEVKQMIDDKGLSDNFVMLGEISEEDKISYMQNCLIYLQPSRYEGFGVAMAEAMSCGAAVITTDAGEVKNVVGDSALLLNGHSSKEISDAIMLLVSDSEKRDALKKLARSRIVDNFGFNVRMEDIKKIL